MASRRRRGRKRGAGVVANLRDPKKIRTLYIIVGLALVFGGSLGFGNATCDKAKRAAEAGAGEKKVLLPTDAIATIDDRSVTYAEYARNFENASKQAEAQDQQQPGTVLHPPEYLADMKYRVIRQLIDMEYFDIRAKLAGINVTKEQVDAKVEEYRKMLVPAVTKAEERSLLERAMDSLSSVKSEQQFENALKRLDPSLSVSRLRELVNQELVAQAYVNKLQEEEQKKINEALTTRMLTIRGEIEGGTDFAEAAKIYSQDSSASAGGLVPLVKHDSADLPKPVTDTSFSLPIGEISQPIIATEPEAKKGIWLMTVVSRKEAGGADWEANKEIVRQDLLDKKKKQVEAGKAQMPETGNLTVSDDEVKTAYEEATIRAIFLKGEDPMANVQKVVEEDMKKVDIKINDPELRATHHIVNQQWTLAAADYEEALQKNQGNLDADKQNQPVIDMEESRLRYLLANLWGTRAFRMEAEWLQKKYQEFQANPKAFAGEFPRTPEDIRQKQQGFFVMSLRNLDRAIQINDIDPWARIQRSQITLAREQVNDQTVDDLRVANQYSSNDFDLENRILSSIKQAISLDDKALNKAGNVRPATPTPAVLPEDAMGITLANTDASYIAVIGQWKSERPQGRAPAAGSTGSGEDILSSSGLSVPESESTSQQSEGDLSTTSDSSESSEEITPQSVPIPQPGEPLTKEMRDILDQLLEDVQRVVDKLTMERQAAEKEKQAQMDQQRQALPVNPPAEGAPTDNSEGDSKNLLKKENQGGQ